MLLKKLYLENFVSHKNTEIEFSKGITVITGKNGAGKTSILDSILFCLFKESRTGNLKDLIHLNSISAKSYLIFEEGLKYYESAWELDRKKGVKSAILKQLPDQILAEGPNNVKQEIEKILGMSKEIAISSIFIKQGEIDALINKKPAERKELIGKLIGIDKLESVWSDFKLILDKFDSNIKNLETDINDLPTLEEKMKDNDNRVKSLSTELSKIEHTINEVSANLDAIGQELEKLAILKEERNILELEIKNYLKNIESADNDIKGINRKLEEIEDKEREIQDLENELRCLEPVTEYLKLKEQLNEYNEHLKEIDKELKIMDGQLTYLKNNEGSYEKYENILKNNDEIQEKLSILKPDHNEYNSLSEKRKDRSNTLSDSQKNFLRFRDLISSIFGVSDISEDSKSALLDSLSREESELSDNIYDAKQRITLYKDRIKYLEDTKEHLTDSKQCPVCKSDLDADQVKNLNIDIDEEISNKSQLIVFENKIIEELKNKLEHLKSRIKKVNAFENNQYFNLKKKISEYENEIDSIDVKLSSIKNNFEEFELLEKKRLNNEIVLGQLRNIHENCIKARAKIENYSEEISKRDDHLNNIEEIMKKLDDIRVIVLFDITESKRKELEKKRDSLNRFRGMIKNKQDYSDHLKQKTEYLEHLKSEHDKVLEMLNLNTFNPENYEKLREDKDILDDSLENIKKEYYKKESDINFYKKLQEENNKKKEELLKKSVELKKFKEFRKVLEQIRASYSKDGVQRMLRTNYASVIENYVKSYVEKFNLDIIDLSIDSDFNITLRNRDGEISIDELSGGERVAIGIALRLAIARALSKRISTIILDEPTTYLDEDRRGELANILRDSISEISSMIPQIIIVTHHEELVDVANTHYEVTKNNGYSSLKIM